MKAGRMVMRSRNHATMQKAWPPAVASRLFAGNAPNSGGDSFAARGWCQARSAGRSGAGRGWWGGRRPVADKRLQAADALHEFAGLRRQLLRRARGLLGAGGVGLRDFVHLPDRLVELADSLTLFLGGGGDRAHERVDVAGLVDDLVQHLRNFLGNRHAAFALVNGILDLRRGFLGGRGRALGQGADLLGDDGETGSGLAGAGSLDGGVEGEDVRLEGDLVDGLDNL